jgi:ferredoxin-NADP reductase
MPKNIITDFDGYNDIVEAIEISRKYGVPYSAAKQGVQQYLDLLHPARLRLRVSDIIGETPSAKTLRLIPEKGQLPPFQAGQYIALLLQLGLVRTSRPYSISSPPNQTGYYDITVRRVEGGLVSGHLLNEVKQGDALESSGPAGHFFHNPLFHDPTMVCLAGGSGITPFMSMIREVVECGLDRTIYLFYGNRTLDEAIFHHPLLRMAERFETIHYLPVIESPPEGFKGLQGLITGDLIQKTLGDLRAKTFFICGPRGMYDFCLSELDKLGIPRKKVRREVYGPPLDISLDPAWPKELGRDQSFTVRVKGGKAIQALAGEPLLLSLEREGIAPPSVCRSGECSMCRVKVLSGRVFQPAGALVRKSDRQFGYVHSCVSYPLEDMEIML